MKTVISSLLATFFTIGTASATQLICESPILSPNGKSAMVYRIDTNRETIERFSYSSIRNGYANFGSFEGVQFEDFYAPGLPFGKRVITGTDQEGEKIISATLTDGSETFKARILNEFDTFTCKFKD